MDDLENTPDDGRRYEWVDGRLDVSPAPEPLHGVVDTRLTMHLALNAPDELLVLTAPGINLDGDHTHHRIPDLAVFDCELPSQGYFDVPPLPAVEIVSPESVLRDDHSKRHEYAAFGTESYWIISPLADKV